MKNAGNLPAGLVFFVAIDQRDHDPGDQKYCPGDEHVDSLFGEILVPVHQFLFRLLKYLTTISRTAVTVPRYAHRIVRLVSIFSCQN